MYTTSDSDSGTKRRGNGMGLQLGFGQFGAAPGKHKLLEVSARWDLQVPFRADFNNFREEVRLAIGQHVTFRSDKGKFVADFLNRYTQELRQFHKTLLKNGWRESSPVAVTATITYTPGFKRAVGFKILT